MASDDAAAPASVMHTEGTSYVVALGDPARCPTPDPELTSATYPDFPAAGGLNPYDSERGHLRALATQLVHPDINVSNMVLTAPTVLVARIAASWTVCIYDILREVSEQSRGLTLSDLMDRLVVYRGLSDSIPALIQIVLNQLTSQPDNTTAQTPEQTSAMVTIVFMSVVRGCRDDKTITTFSTKPEADLVEGNPLRAKSGLANFLYFNLSARERTRLKKVNNGLRRMPYVLSRQLILRKAPTGGGPRGRFIRRNFMPDSEELFRVVVAFL